MKQILLWLIEHSRTFLIIYGIAFFVILAIIIENIVSPGYTEGLNGTPNELKLKYLADTALKGLSEQEMEDKAREAIRAKEKDLIAMALLLLLRYLYFGGMLPVE